MINEQILRNISAQFSFDKNHLEEGWLSVAMLFKVTAKKYFFQMVNSSRGDLKTDWKPAWLIGSAVQQYATRNTLDHCKEREVLWETRIPIKRKNKAQNLVIKGSADWMEQPYREKEIHLYEFKYAEVKPDKQHPYCSAMVQCQTYAYMLNDMFSNKDSITLKSYFNKGLLTVNKPARILCHVIIINNNEVMMYENEWSPSVSEVIMQWILRKAHVLAEAGHHYKENANRSYELLEKFDRTAPNPFYNAEQYFPV